MLELGLLNELILLKLLNELRELLDGGDTDWENLLIDDESELNGLLEDNPDKLVMLVLLVDLDGMLLLDGDIDSENDS